MSTHLSMPSMMVSTMARLPSCERRWTRFDYNHYLRKAEMPDRVGHDDKTNGGLTKNERNEQIYLQISCCGSDGNHDIFLQGCQEQ